MAKALLCITCLYVFIYCCYGAPCTFTASDGSFYDLSSLTMHVGSPYYTYLYDVTNYTYNICDQITGGMVGTGAPYCLIGTAVCQGDRGTYYSVGMASNMSIAESPLGPASGVVIYYGSGQACKARNREVKLDFTCTPGVSGIVVKSLAEPLTCSYEFHVESSAACPISSSTSAGLAVTTTAATTTSASIVTATTSGSTTTSATIGVTGTTATTGGATSVSGPATITGATSTGATSDSTATTTTATTAASTATTTATTATITTTTSSSTTTPPSTTSSSATTSPTSTASSTSTTATSSTAPGSTTQHPTTGTTTDSDDPDIHDTPAGKALIGIVVGLGVFVVIVSVLLVRELRRRRQAQSDHQMERLRLTGSTYSDTKKRYLK